MIIWLPGFDMTSLFRAAIGVDVTGCPGTEAATTGCGGLPPNDAAVTGAGCCGPDRGGDWIRAWVAPIIGGAVPIRGCIVPRGCAEIVDALINGWLDIIGCDETNGDELTRDWGELTRGVGPAIGWEPIRGWTLPISGSGPINGWTVPINGWTVGAMGGESSKDCDNGFTPEIRSGTVLTGGLTGWTKGWISGCPEPKSPSNDWLDGWVGDRPEIRGWGGMLGRGGMAGFVGGTICCDWPPGTFRFIGLADSTSQLVVRSHRDRESHYTLEKSRGKLKCKETFVGIVKPHE